MEDNWMNPLIISAQFAAYVWFTAQEDNAGKGRGAATRFARQQWEDFLPLAHKGLGRLLLRMADMPLRKSRKVRVAQALLLALPAPRVVAQQPPATPDVYPAPFSCN
jgi:hypothetical protein